MNVLVTGGCGFIGHHLVRALLERGDAVTVLDNFSTGSRDRLQAGAVLAEGDIRDRTFIDRLFAEGRFETVFHTAALARIQPSIQDPIASHDVNVNGTHAMLDAARRHGVRRLVYSSSSSIYGPQAALPYHEGMAASPQNPYALQKWMGEELCRLYSSVYGLDTVCLRYFNVYGPGMIPEGAYCTVISIFLKQAQDGAKLTITGDGSQRRDFTHVSDIVAGNLAAAAAASPLRGEAFNLGYGRNVSVREIAEMILAARRRSWEDDVAFLPPRPNETQETLADYAKAREAFGWQPRVVFKDGLAELLASTPA